MSTHSLTRLRLSDIPSLVVLPSSIQNFNKLKHFVITNCINLETLPSGINFQHLRKVHLMRCPRLKTFPDISTRISCLLLNKTGIEEVPWWIEKFSRLSSLGMNGCNRLQRVSLNISKLKRLGEIDFSDCGALTEARWNDCPTVVAMKNAHAKEFDDTDLGDEDYDDTDLYSKDSDDTNSGSETDFSQIFEENYPYLLDNFQMVSLNFINCFNLDHEALLEQETNIVRSITLSGEEVPSYFTHRTTGISLTNIPLLQTSLSQPFFRFRACVVVGFESLHRFEIQVCCQFKDKFGNHFDSSYQHYQEDNSENILYDCSYQYPEDRSEYSHMVIFDCYFPLNEDNTPLPKLSYDHVDIQFQLNPNHYQSKVQGCGIRISEDDISSDDDGLGIEPGLSEECLYNSNNYLGDETDCREYFEDWGYCDIGSHAVVREEREAAVNRFMSSYIMRMFNESCLIATPTEETDFGEMPLFNFNNANYLGEMTDYSENNEDFNDSDLSNEIDHSEECEDNDVM